MSDVKAETSYLNQLRTISDLAEAILRSLNHTKISIVDIERDLKYFLKECRKIKLIKYPISFLNSEISGESLNSALDAISKKLELFQKKEGISSAQPEEIAALLKVTEVIISYQEKKHFKNTPQESKKYPKEFREFENIVQVFYLFKDKCELLSDTEKFIEKYPVDAEKTGIKDFKKSIKYLYHKFFEACRQAKLLPIEPNEVLGLPIKPDKKSIRNIYSVKFIKEEIARIKSADKDERLHKTLDFIEAAAGAIIPMYNKLPDKLRKMDLIYDNSMFPGWLEDDEDEEIFELKSTIVDTLTKDNIRHILGMLNVRDRRVELNNFSDKLLIKALKQAVSENISTAAILISAHLTERQKPRQGIFSPSRKLQVDLQKQEILDFLIAKSKEGNETAKYLILSHNFESKRRTLSSPLPVRGESTRIQRLTCQLN
ncbi:MAG TPA: hypothetical protein VHE99_10850 [Gammaproteobacteria bacterium]|nr:hypothetical protein [Gammaproteobacteria bacterium]